MTAVSVYLTCICAFSARFLFVAANSDLCDSIPAILDQLKQLQSRVDVLEQRSDTLSKIESIFGGADAVDELVKKKSIIQRILSVEERLDVLENVYQGVETDDDSLETDIKTSRQDEDIPHSERSESQTPRIRQIPTTHTIGFTAELSTMDLHFPDEHRTIVFDHVIRQIPTAHAIGFTAMVSTLDLHFLDEHRTIVFDRVISNIGNAYHPHTGIFVVPFSGVYVFSVTVMSSPGKTIRLELMVDGRSVCEIYSSNNQFYNTASGTYVLQLIAGSDVWIETGDYGTNYDVHGNSYTSLTGFLLQRT
ncbi:hypothetical protein ACF0H5_003500 [Mactra antiquata]